jgi:hypothetical protein
MSTPVPVTSVPFVDGISRDVYLDDGDRPYIFGEDGQPVYGVWIYIDESEIVTRAGILSRLRRFATKNIALETKLHENTL